jgi:hypothetical protein
VSKLNLPQTIINLTNPADIQKWTQIMLRSIVDEFNGRVSFVDNVQGVVLPVEFTAADTTVEVTHALNYIPNGYVLVGSSAAMVIYDGDGVSTRSVIYLKSDAIGTARIKIF